MGINKNTKSSFALISIIIGLFCSIAFTQNTTPEVTNVTFAQRTDGSGIVDVYYDVSDTEGDLLTITMEVSNDGGSSWNFSCTLTSGDIGENITSGANKYIMWDFGIEHPDIFSNQIMIKIIADDNAIVNCGTVPDIDGNVYQTVIIGGQCWTAENLKTTHYNNGNEIPNITNNDDWGNLTTGAYGDYDNNPTNSETYGRLYNWYTVDDSRGVCPDGYHVPSDDEYTVLTDYLSGTSVAGGKMKETGLDHWNSPNTGATNESGFTALPAGSRDLADGDFDDMGSAGYFWSSSEHPSYDAWRRILHYNDSSVSRGNHYKQHGLSIRCIGDQSC